MKKEIICSDCGSLFELNINQIKKLKNKGFKVPSHCPMCRSYRWKEVRLKKKRAKKFERKKHYEKFRFD